MKSILLFVFSLSIAVQAASVLPADRSSSSSVHVQQGDNEYSYSIHESRGVQQSESPGTKKIPQQIIVNTLQSEIGEASGETRDPKIQDQGENREQRGVDGSNISDGREVKGMEYKEVDNQPRQGLNILVPIENQSQGEFLMPGHRQVKGLQLLGSDNQPQPELKISVPVFRDIKEQEVKSTNGQSQEELKISIPGYRLIPTTDVQYTLNQPLYYPYYPLYGNNLYNFVRYI